MSHGNASLVVVRVTLPGNERVNFVLRQWVTAWLKRPRIFHLHVFWLRRPTALNLAAMCIGNNFASRSTLT